MRRISLISLLLTLIAVGCGDGHKAVLQGKHAFIENMVEEDISLDEGAISDSISALVLEAGKESLLDSRSHIVYVDSTNIFVKSAAELLRFDRKGNFVNKIGKTGQGPLEYVRAQDVSVDAGEGMVYVFDGVNKVVSYDFNGTPHNEVFINRIGVIKGLYAVDSVYMALENDYGETGALRQNVNIYDRKGRLIRSVGLSTDELSMDVTYQSAPVNYVKDGRMFVKNSFDEELVSVGIDGEIGKEYFFDAGKYHVGREVLEDMNRRKARSEDYVEVVDICETSGMLYMVYVYGMRARGLVIAKESGLVVYSGDLHDVQKCGGMPIPSLDGIYAWPTYADKEGTLYALADLTDSEESQIKAIKKVQSNNLSLDFDANPVMIVFHHGNGINSSGLLR